MENYVISFESCIIEFDEILVIANRHMCLSHNAWYMSHFDLVPTVLSLCKVIMQGCVEGRRKPGRPRTRWIDQIKSMVGCPLHELYNLVQDRQRWCDVVAVASCQSWQDRTDRPTDRPTDQLCNIAICTVGDRVKVPIN